MVNGLRNGSSGDNGRCSEIAGEMTYTADCTWSLSPACPNPAFPDGLAHLVGAKCPRDSRGRAMLSSGSVWRTVHAVARVAYLLLRKMRMVPKGAGTARVVLLNDLSPLRNARCQQSRATSGCSGRRCCRRRGPVLVQKNAILKADATTEISRSLSFHGLDTCSCCRRIARAFFPS